MDCGSVKRDNVLWKFIHFVLIKKWYNVNIIIMWESALCDIPITCTTNLTVLKCYIGDYSGAGWVSGFNVSTIKIRMKEETF